MTTITMMTENRGACYDDTVAVIVAVGLTCNVSVSNFAEVFLYFCTHTLRDSTAFVFKQSQVDVSAYISSGRVVLRKFTKSKNMCLPE